MIEQQLEVAGVNCVNDLVLFIKQEYGQDHQDTGCSVVGVEMFVVKESVHFGDIGDAV